MALANNASRKTTKHWLYFGIFVWAFSVILVAVVGSYVLIRNQQIAQDLCRVSSEQRNILKEILKVSKEQELEGTTNIFQRNLIRQQYSELLVLIPPLKCTIQGGPQELEP